MAIRHLKIEDSFFMREKWRMDIEGKFIISVANYLSSLILNFFLCELGVIAVPTSLGCCEG